MTADQNLLVIKDEWNLDDLDAVLLSDILPTAWHANELGGVRQQRKFNAVMIVHG